MRKVTKMKKILVTSLLIMAAVGINASAATFYAEMTNDDYTPAKLYVPVGTTVSWKNFGTHTHDVVSNTGLFNSGPITTGGSFSYTFNSVGDYGYYCTYHDSIPVPMIGTVYVRTTAQLTALLTLTPVRPPIVIPPGGGNFQFQLLVTNQGSSTLISNIWTKIYYPNNTFNQTWLKTPQFPPGTRGATLQQSLPASAPAGSYIFQGNLGTNPDSVFAWANFTLSKSAVDNLEGTGWEVVMVSDWQDMPNPTAPAVNVTATSTSKLSLSNSPEPFNPSTAINFSLPADGMAHLEVFNINGAKLATLVNGYRQAGNHQVTFDASNLPSGMYLYRLNFGAETVVNKMMLVK
jgi:plastocyanin